MRLELVPGTADGLLSSPKRLRLWPRHGQAGERDARQVEVEKWRTTGGGSGAIVGLRGVAGRDAAAALKGLQVGVDRALCAELSGDEFYLQDLVGASAISAAGEPLGRVSALYDNQGQDLIGLSETPGYDGQEMLVPLTEDTIVTFDPADRQLTLRLSAGLLAAQVPD